MTTTVIVTVPCNNLDKRVRIERKTPSGAIHEIVELEKGQVSPELFLHDNSFLVVTEID